MKGETLLLVLLTVVLAFWVGTLYTSRKQIQTQDAAQVPTVIVEESPPPLPYWTAYGLPTYWPTYLSPYWYFDMPWYGPINSPWAGGRDRYRPGHGPGYSGVAGGGFGSGSGHGGGHGGGGGGGHH